MPKKYLTPKEIFTSISRDCFLQFSDEKNVIGENDTYPLCNDPTPNFFMVDFLGDFSS